jgi:hypothetical protein
MTVTNITPTSLDLMHLSVWFGAWMVIGAGLAGFYLLIARVVHGVIVHRVKKQIRAVLEAEYADQRNQRTKDLADFDLWQQRRKLNAVAACGRRVH